MLAEWKKWVRGAWVCVCYVKNGSGEVLMVDER